jgi:poly-beta-hydroxyalkanoate depolymerase
MKNKGVSIAPLFALSALMTKSPLDARSNPANNEEIADMKARQIMVEGVVTHLKSGLY